MKPTRSRVDHALALKGAIFHAVDMEAAKRAYYDFVKTLSETEYDELLTALGVYDVKVVPKRAPKDKGKRKGA